MTSRWPYRPVTEILKIDAKLKWIDVSETRGLFIGQILTDGKSKRAYCPVIIDHDASQIMVARAPGCKPVLPKWEVGTLYDLDDERPRPQFINHYDRTTLLKQAMEDMRALIDRALEKAAEDWDRHWLGSTSQAQHQTADTPPAKTKSRSRPATSRTR